MKRIWRENWRLVLCTVLALIAGILMGMTIGLSMASKQAAEATESVEAGNVGRERILPSTGILLHAVFSGCGHEKTILLDNTPYIGMSELELGRSLTDETIESFSAERVYLHAQREGYCPDHLVLKAEEGMLCVYRTKQSTLEKELMYRLTVPEGQRPFPQEDALREEGLVFNSLSEINAYLESAES